MRRLLVLAAATSMFACVAATTGALLPATASVPYSFAVIGDLPYGPPEYALFANRIDQLNSAENVQMAVHLGDITSGGVLGNCTDEYNATIKSEFDRFAGPFVYTPGDNEWADCLRSGTGPADPWTRLAAVRQTFFPTPGMTLGSTPMAVTAQEGYPENISFDQGGLSVAVVHLIGSNNGLTAWPGLKTATPEQLSEMNARVAADITIMRDTFARAKAVGSRGVLILTQANVFSGSSATYKSAFKPFVVALAAEARAFRLPVLLINGDTHTYKKDKPLTLSTWKKFYGVTTSVSNLTRVVVKAGTSEWLRVTVVDSTTVFQTQRVPFAWQL